MKTVRAALVGLMVVGGADAQVRGGTETRFYGWSMDVTYTWETERGYQGSSGWLGLDPAVDWASPWTMDLRDRRGRDDRCVYPPLRSWSRTMDRLSSGARWCWAMGATPVALARKRFGVWRPKVWRSRRFLRMPLPCVCGGTPPCT